MSNMHFYYYLIKKLGTIAKNLFCGDIRSLKKRSSGNISINNIIHTKFRVGEGVHVPASPGYGIDEIM